MAVCTKCGKEMKAEAKFCTACGVGAGRHEDRKARVLAAEKKSAKTGIAVAAAVVIIVVGWAVYSGTSRARSMDRPMMKGEVNREGNKNVPYTTVIAQNGEVKIALDALKGDAAAYFIFKAAKGDVKFIVLRAADGTIRVSLDACQACYHAKLGYGQKGDTLVCNNCGMGFKSTDVGNVTGGCSPIPVQNSQDGRTLTVKASDLAAGVKYF